MQNELLVIYNITRNEPTILDLVAAKRNVKITRLFLDSREFFPVDLAPYKAVVVLGGPDSANDDTEKMKNEINFVGKIIDTQIPFLGICLGMQILVKAAGGTVIKSPFKETGFYDQHGNRFEVELQTLKTDFDPLFSGVSKNFPVFQLHGESVLLKNGIEHLGRGNVIENQIIKIGSNAYGLQFHFELTQALFERLIDRDPELRVINRTQLLQQFADIKTQYDQIGEKICNNFLDLSGF